MKNISINSMTRNLVGNQQSYKSMKKSSYEYQMFGKKQYITTEWSNYHITYMALSVIFSVTPVTFWLEKFICNYA